MHEFHVNFAPEPSRSARFSLYVQEVVQQLVPDDGEAHCLAGLSSVASEYGGFEGNVGRVAARGP